MALKRVNIIGEEAWHVFIDIKREDLEILLREHLGMTGRGTNDLISFNEETIGKLNQVLISKKLKLVQIIKEKITLEEYENLGLPNASACPGQEYLSDHFCLYSYKDWEYDTISGRLENGCYAIQPSGMVVYKQLGKEQKSFSDELDFLKGIK